MYFYKISRAAADNRSRGKSYSNTQRGSAARRKCNRQALQLFELLACNGNFLWEGVREGYLFFEKRYPSLAPSQRKFTLQVSSSKRCGACRLHFPARGRGAFSAAIRFASASTIRSRSASLVAVQPNFRLTEHSTMRRAKQCRIPQAVCRRANVTRASR